MEKNPSGDGPSAEDRDLFLAAVQGVQPIRRTPRVEHRASPPPPVPVQSILDDHAALQESASGAFAPELSMHGGEELWFLRPGLSESVVRKLRRGHWVVQEEADLHGLNSEQARCVLGDFVRESLRAGRRCVRIVHGKGLRSPNREPVLKKKVKAWLAQREEVLAFCQAPATQGGSGALLVLLAPRRRGAGKDQRGSAV